jgi:hypothetical protein
VQALAKNDAERKAAASRRTPKSHRACSTQTAGPGVPSLKTALSHRDPSNQIKSNQTIFPVRCPANTSIPQILGLFAENQSKPLSINNLHSKPGLSNQGQSSLIKPNQGGLFMFPAPNQWIHFASIRAGSHLPPILHLPPSCQTLSNPVKPQKPGLTRDWRLLPWRGKRLFLTFRPRSSNLPPS